MYTIYVVFECFEGKREAFVEKVKSEGIVDAVRNEDGCYRYDYYYSEKNPDELRRVYALGRRAAKNQLKELQLFLEG